MPLEAAFFALDDHALAVVAHDHASLHAATSSALWPARRRAIPTALLHAEEEDTRSLMQITKIGLPDQAKLQELEKACKLDNFASAFGDASDGAPRSAKGLGEAVSKSSNCAANTSDLVLRNIFGQKLESAGMGVTFEKTHDIPLGSLARKELKSAKSACQDFGSFLLHRFEKPGLAPSCSAAGGASGAKFTQQDATHALKSFGLCLDSIGETTALQGCEMGNLQRVGTAEAANLCKVVEGPLAREIVCAIL